MSKCLVSCKGNLEVYWVNKHGLMIFDGDIVDGNFWGHQ